MAIKAAKVSSSWRCSGMRSSRRLRALTANTPRASGRRAQRNIQDFAAGQGIRAEAGRLALVERPLRDADVDRKRRIGARRGAAQLARGIRQQQSGARAKGAFDGFVADPDDLIDLHRARQIARDFVQRTRPLLAVRGDARLKSQAGGQLPRDQADGQHDDEGQNVLHIAHRERRIAAGRKRNRRNIRSAPPPRRRRRGRIEPRSTPRSG